MLRVAACVAAALLAFVACYSKPDAPHLGDEGGVPDDALHLDGITRPGEGSIMIDAPDVPPCMLTTIADFNGAQTSGCPSNFLTATDMGTAVGYGGTLDMSLPALPGYQASCRLNNPVNFAGGVFVEITAVPSTNQAQVVVTVTVQNGAHTIKLGLLRSPMGVYANVSCDTTSTVSQALTLSAPYLVRFQGNGAADETIDVGIKTVGGASFTSISTCALSGSAGSALPVLSAISGSGSTSTASFDNLQACP